jgi:hypothetical protein
MVSVANGIKDIPHPGKLPSKELREVFQTVLRVREEVQRLTGFRGDVADQALTLRTGLTVGGVTTIPGPPGPPGPAGGSSTPDLTPPPDVTNFAAVAAITHVIVTFDAPTFTVGHGPLETIIYGVQKNPGDPNPVFGDAQRVYGAPAPLSIAAIPSEPNIRWHLWAKYRSIDGVESVNPVGGTNGVIVTTGQDVSHLLAVLSGQITSSQLHTALNTRIDLIDAASSVPGSVNARIATEAATRTSADNALATSITNLSATVSTLDGEVDSNFTTLNSAIQTEATARASGDATNASAITTVQSRIDNGNASQFDPEIVWDFQNTLDGWSVAGATASVGSNYVTLTSSGIDPTFRSPAALGLAGATHNKVRARVMRTAGSGWDGKVFYVTAGHGESGSFNKTVTPDPTVLNQWVTIEWDMEALTAGGTDWTTSTITQIRVDLGATAADVFRIDWVAVGSRGVGVAAAVVQQEISTRAAETGYLGAQYTVRAQVTQGGRTVVGGFGLSATSSPNAGPTIDFGVIANKFWVAAPQGTSGVSDIAPFVIQTTSETVNGVVIPPGVYMDAAYIKNLTALWGRFGTLVADSISTAQLNAAQLTLGNGTVGGNLRSTNFSSGVAGWLMQPNGNVEMNSLVARGNSTFDGLVTIRDQGGGIVFASGGTLDWSRVSGTARPRAYRVVSRGIGSSGAPLEAGFYDAEANSLIFGRARSYMLVRINRATRAVDFFQYYDVIGNGATSDGRNAATLAADLNATGSTHIVVLYTHDEPQVNRTTGGLPAAIYRCGGSPGKFESDLFAFRGAYMLIGVGGCGPGNAFFEQYAGGGTDTGSSGPDNAWIDSTFYVVNGNAVVSGSGLGGFQINGANITTYIANAAIGNAQIGGDIQSDDFIAGAQGWRIRKSTGSAEFRNVVARGDIQATSLNAATGTFTGSLSGASGTFGTITSGLLRNAANTAWIDLDATGAQNFIVAQSGAVRVTADGDAYFTKSLASGTWSGSLQLIDAVVDPEGGGNTLYLTPEKTFLIDTGYSKPWNVLFERTMTARVGSFTSTHVPGESANQYVGTISAEITPVVNKPAFQTPITSPVGNPYGAGNERVMLRVRVQLADRDNKTSFVLTSLQWTLDTSG